jgi:hypothetical protein
MEKSESIKNLTQAIITVMASCKGIEKNLTVGEGRSSYKGVADKDVKSIIGELMVKNGLAIIPTGIEETTQIESWKEAGQYGEKHKQSVFTKVTTSYILSHVSGEWIEIKGIGHGVDSQDKSAGKATTYALKYALLYLFMVPTGTIDDADNNHSDTIEVPPTEPQKEKKQAPKKKIILTPTHEKWAGAIDFLKGTGTMTELLKFYEITSEDQKLLIDKTLE